jgi:hypothetical protein
MGLITGRYLEDPQNPDLAIWEPEDIPPVAGWPEGLPDIWTIEDMELLFLTLLRMMDADGVPFAVPSFELEERLYPLSREAVSDLSDDAQDRVMWFAATLIVNRLVRDEDEEVLPESLARKLLTVAGIERPEDPFTVSFGSAAGIVLELLPCKG